MGGYTGCSGADPGIIPGENVPENPGSSRVFPVFPLVFPVSSRCSRISSSSVRPGMGPVYSRRTPVVDASRSHPGPTGAAWVFYSYSLDMGCIFTYLIQMPISTSTLIRRRQDNVSIT